MSLTARVRAIRQLAAERHLDSEDWPAVPCAKPPGALRLVTLNLAHGRHLGPHQALQSGSSMRSNLVEIATTLRQIEPDLVALQEADGPSAWSGNFDHVATLSKLAGLETHFRGKHHRFSWGRHNLDYGTALLASGPLHKPSSQRFAQSWRDTKGFVLATIPLPAANRDSARPLGDAHPEIDVVSAHLDFLAPSVRRRQIAHLVSALSDRNRPLVVLGDFNTMLPGDRRVIDILGQKLRLEAHQPDANAPTFPVPRPVRRLDWILASPELEFCSYTTLPTPLSDHLAVVADLRLTSTATEHLQQRNGTD